MTKTTDKNTMKRRLQVKEASRKHRMRNKLHLAELEARLSALEAEISKYVDIDTLNLPMITTKLSTYSNGSSALDHHSSDAKKAKHGEDHGTKSLGTASAGHEANQDDTAGMRSTRRSGRTRRQKILELDDDDEDNSNQGLEKIATTPEKQIKRNRKRKADSRDTDTESGDNYEYIMPPFKYDETIAVPMTSRTNDFDSGTDESANNSIATLLQASTLLEAM